MQTGTLANWDIDKTRLPQAFDLGVAWLLAHLDAPCGRHEIDGGHVYVSISEPGTKDPCEGRLESHLRYADLQVLLEGAERQDYCTHYPEGSAEEDRLAEQDVAFWPPQPAVQSVVLAPMDYTLYYPRELHAPNLAVDRPGPTRKAVVKVSAELF